MKRAFTLAEVLVTLAIIGVIAAISVPTLIQTLDNMSNKTLLKENYALIAQASQKLKYDEGSFVDICETSQNTCIRDKFLNYLNYTKKCSSSINSEPDTFEGCFARPNTNWLTLDKKDPVVGNDASAILANGTSLHFWQTSGDCTGGPTQRTCTRIYMDINGLAKPNVTGKDIFLFVLTRSLLEPATPVNFSLTEDSGAYEASKLLLK